MFNDARGYCRDGDGFVMNPLGAFERVGRSARLLKKGDAPSADPNIGVAAQRQMDLAQTQYEDFSENFAPLLKEQLGKGIVIADQQNQRAQDLQDYQMDRARVYDDRWDTVQAPLEDEIIAKARAYNEPAEQERMASQAGEDVAVAFGQARGQTMRALQARGLNPGSGAVISALGDSSLSQAMAAASAVNKTREAAKQIGWTKLGEAAALGRGLPSFGTASASLSLGAGQAALGAGTAGVGMVGQASGANAAGYGASAGMYGQAAGALNQQFSNQVSAYQAQASNDPLNSVLGAATGAGMKYALGLSDRRAKTDIKRVGTLDSGLPVYSFRYKSGGPVQLGVMADEVAVIAPRAYHPRAINGYDAVDYSML